MIGRHKKGVIRELQGMKQVEQSRYLGLPLVIGRSKKQTFEFIRHKTLDRLKGWKEKLLSKLVLVALAIYVMSCCMILKNLCKKISSEIAKFQ